MPTPREHILTRENERRVVITGMGVVTSVGTDIASFQEALWANQSNWTPLPGLDGTRVGAVDDSTGWASGVEGTAKRYSDRAGHLALVAARQAIKNAALDLQPRPRRRHDPSLSPEQESFQDRIDVIVGSSIGGISSLWDEFSSATVKGPEAMTPFVLARALINMIPATISIDLGVRGEAWGVAGACAAGTMAIGQAYRRVRSGMCDIAIAGGTDACLVPTVVTPFQNVGAMSPVNQNHGIRPFAHDRNGFLMGEGAGMLVVESSESAYARKATILAEIVDFYAGNDASSLFAPDTDGVRASVAGLLDNGRVSADEIIHINAHGTGTVANDAVEAQVYGELFPQRPAVSAIKANVGHTLGAAGAIEAIATVLALRAGMAPPIAGVATEDLDPALNLALVTGNPQPLPRGGVALSSSFAFGGQNAVLALR